MFDSQHGDAESSAAPDAGADRDVKIEQLLLAGLDHYFKSQHERAIDVWSRVLFLDRTHARARAYIERARAALAERLRESEELLHSGAEAFQRGDVGVARELLTSAVERGGGRDEALAILDRLNRLEGALGKGPVVRQGDDEPMGRVGPRGGAPGLSARRRVRVVPIFLLSVLLLASTWATVSRERWVPTVLGSTTQRAPVPAAGLSEPLPVPSAGEVALARARRLADDGRGPDALRLLESIGPGDPLRLEADSLRTAIQQDLLFPSRGDPPDDASLERRQP